MLKGDSMKQIYRTSSSKLGASEDVFIIPQPVFNALHPIEQLMARALEKVGKVRIVVEDDREFNW
jgi:hypothetical protein